MKKFAIIAILIIIGLLLLLWQTNIKVNSFLYFMVGNVANTLIVGATLSLLYQFFQKEDDEKNLLRMLKISFSVHDSGLRQIMTNSADYKFDALLKNYSKFVAVMNDGLRWTGNHSVQLEERFAKNGTETEFYFVDPESDFCKALGKKTDVTNENLKNKILQTVELIKTTYNRSEKKGILRIYFLKNYPTQSIFLTEDKIIVTPYQIASGRNIIPLFEYELNNNKKSLAFHIANDLDNVKKESLLIFENK